jgi:transcriptional regulator with XRE-family HTH domain
MNFGDKVRQLRTDRNLTQPELAEAMGIEQSYLSKLENGKSLPSNDVLNRILDVFAIEIGDLVDNLDQGVRNQLRHIPDIADHFNRQKQLMIGNRQRWLLASSVLVAVGVALIYAGSVHLFFSDTVYQYKSDGIVLEGESKEVFRDPQVPRGADNEQAAAIVNAIRARIDEDFLRTEAFTGNVFNVPVEGGSRTYYLQNNTRVDPWQNKAITFLGVLMFVFGIIGLVLEKKLSRYQ